jgi:hypothetical protein
VACASIFGIDEPIFDVEGGAPGDDGSTDGTVVGEGASGDGGAHDADAANVDADATADAIADAAPDADAAPMDSAVVVPDAAVCGTVPDSTMGVFVAPNGVDNSACGSSLAPCLTIQYGISRANSRPNVYVAAGTYAESIVLSAGITIWGGWNVEIGDGGDSWTGICPPTDPVGAVVIEPATSNITVTANALGGSAVLKTLTLKSKAQSSVAAGESLYGVFATGTTTTRTTLTLDNVDITLGNGGDGTAGYTADGGVEGNPGGCNPGTGAAGSPGGVDGGGADAGTFTMAGYQATPGDTGGNGNTGSNGRVNDGGTCVSCVTCSVPVLYCQSGSAPPSCGNPGGNGCGGAGGNGGGPGGGGGSSIAIFTWGASVTVAGGTISAGNGGQGGSGGGGGPGGGGGTGTTGSPGLSCTVNCNIGGLNLLSCPSGTTGEGGGGLGTTGGNGSGGGAGGGGAGGWSCAIYEGTGASVGYSATLTHGNFGTSPGGGASGKSGDTCPPP